MDMPDVTSSYGTLFDFIAFLGIFIHNWYAFMSKLLSIHPTFKVCMSNQNIHFDMFKYQMWLQVMEWFLILLRFIFFLNINTHVDLVRGRL